MSITFAWNGVVARPLLPASGETVNSEPIVVPAFAKQVTVHVPSLVGTTTLKFQSLVPNEDVDATRVWQDVSAFDPTDGSYEALDGMPESTSVTFPVPLTGSGVLRLVASNDQSSLPVRVPVFFGV